MRTFLSLCAAVVLSLALAGPAPAGVISTGIAEPTPTPVETSASATDAPVAADGTMYPGVAQSEPEAGTVAEIAMTVLQSALSLF